LPAPFPTETAHETATLLAESATGTRT